MNFIKKIIGVFILGIVFSGGVVFAAWAKTTWNDPNTWISDGAVISAQKIAENFEYLKVRTAQNTTYINNISTGVSQPPVCVGINKLLQWNGSAWRCDSVKKISGDVVAGCPVDSRSWMPVSTCWGGASRGWTTGICPAGSTYKLMGQIYDSSGISYGGFDGSFVCLKN